MHVRDTWYDCGHFRYCTATYDVQNLMLESSESENDGIKVTGKLITNSRARGCFIVLQGNSSTADIFQAIQRNGQTVSGIISAPPATYTVYGYDIEETALLTPLPAAVLSVETYNTTSKYGAYNMLCL